MHAPRDLDNNDLGSHTSLMLRAEAWEGSCYCELLFFLAFSYPFLFPPSHDTAHHHPLLSRLCRQHLTVYAWMRGIPTV